MYLKIFTTAGLVIIFTAWLNYELKKASREDSAGRSKFWARESEALLTPRKSMDDVNFITIPKEIIPKKIKPEVPDPEPSPKNPLPGSDTDPDNIIRTEFPEDGDYDDEDEDEDEDTSDSYETHVERINTYSAELKALSKLKIADLSEYTNTDLRLKYGSPNFNQLFEADNNFTRLIQILPNLIRSLIKVGKVDEAAKLLDFCDKNKIETGEIRKLKNELS